jgi:hypothetical protein
MNSSTSFLDQLRQDFHTNPINTRVCLPDGSLAVIRSFVDTDEGRAYRVQGIHRNGRFRALQSVSPWFRADELRMVYYSASINSEWQARAKSDTRNGTV